jgi:hypothetical protein
MSINSQQNLIFSIYCDIFRVVLSIYPDDDPLESKHVAINVTIKVVLRFYAHLKTRIPVIVTYEILIVTINSLFEVFTY